jgi:hypothetical protein
MARGARQATRRAYRAARSNLGYAASILRLSIGQRSTRRNGMRTSALALIAAAGLAVGLAAGATLSGAAQAAPAGPLGTAADELGVVAQAQYIYGGHNYCFYIDGWHGPGWYWCGYGSRRGYGWGGVEGWHNWHGGGHGHVVVHPHGHAVHPHPVAKKHHH